MPTALMKKIAKENERMANGQLGRLMDRTNAHQQQKRTAKIAARRTAHEQLKSEQRQFMLGVAQGLNAHFKRGFFGRMKFLLFGK